MPIDTPCREYRLAIEDWRRMRHVMAGQRAMRDNAEFYLRRPGGLVDNTEWAQYVMAAGFFEATGRTMEGLTGLAFYRDPEFTLPDEMKAFVDDVTQDGIALRQFTERVFEEILTLNRAIVLVDYPLADPSIQTLREAEAVQRRPFLRQYLAEEAFSWTETMVRGVKTLTEVRVWEIETEQLGDWDSRWRYRIRVFQLVPTAQGRWIYQQRIFVNEEWIGGIPDVDTSADTTGSTGYSPIDPSNAGAIEPGQEWTELSPITPLIDGQPLGYLPIWIINATDQSPAVKRPPLLPLANVNIMHFNTSAALENALFWCGNPTPYVTGVDPGGDNTLLVGSSKAWLIGEVNAKVDFLSYGADNLKPLEDRLNRLEQHMAVLGARMLSADTKGVEAAETARIHRQGEISVLAGVCGSVSRAMTDVCESATAWAQVAGPVTVTIFTSFYDAVISSTDALNFMKLWQQGLIAPSDLLALLKKGEIVAGDRTVEAIVSENQSSAIQPMVMAGLTGAGGAGGAGGGIPGQPSRPSPAPAQQE